MKGKHEKAGSPAAVVRASLWMVSLLLVIVLLGTLLGGIVLQLISDQRLHERVATDAEVLQEQEARLEKTVDRLAEEYSFDARRVREKLSRDTLILMNQQAVNWWMNLARSGKAAEIPQWDGDQIWNALMEDEAFLAAQEGGLARKNASDVVYAISNTLTRQVFPLREELLTEGIDFLGRRIDLGSVLLDLRKLPLLLGICSLALIGLIVLLSGGRRAVRNRFLGGAIGGAGILLALGVAAFRLINLSGMAGEASRRFGLQIRILERMVTIEGLVLVALLAGAACFCFLSGRGREKDGRHA